VPAKEVTGTPRRRSTPWSRWSSAKTALIRGVDDPRQQRVRGFQQGGLCSEGAGAGSDFSAEESRSHDCDPAVAQQVGAERFGVVQGSEDVDAGQVGAGAAGPGPGGDHHGVGDKGGPVGQLHCPVTGAQRHGPHSQAEVQGERGELVVGAQPHAFAGILAGQDFFGQRWPLVGAVGFVTDERDGSVEACLSQRFGGGEAGHAGTGYNDGLHLLLRGSMGWTRC